MSKDTDFDSELESEVHERLALMEEPGYVYPKALGRVDWALIVACPIVSIVLLIIGEFL